MLGGGKEGTSGAVEEAIQDWLDGKHDRYDDRKLDVDDDRNWCWHGFLL